MKSFDPRRLMKTHDSGFLSSNPPPKGAEKPSPKKGEPQGRNKRRPSPSGKKAVRHGNEPGAPAQRRRPEGSFVHLFVILRFDVLGKLHARIADECKSPVLQDL